MDLWRHVASTPCMKSTLPRTRGNSHCLRPAYLHDYHLPRSLHSSRPVAYHWKIVCIDVQVPANHCGPESTRDVVCQRIKTLWCTTGPPDNDKIGRRCPISKFRDIHMVARSAGKRISLRSTSSLCKWARHSSRNCRYACHFQYLGTLPVQMWVHALCDCQTSEAPCVRGRSCIASRTN